MEAVPFFESGNLSVKLGDDPPGILVEGITAYRQALIATRNEDERLRYENAKKKTR